MDLIVPLIVALAIAIPMALAITRLAMLARRATWRGSNVGITSV